jgi:hypothetical protein
MALIFLVVERFSKSGFIPYKLPYYKLSYHDCLNSGKPETG